MKKKSQTMHKRDIDRAKLEKRQAKLAKKDRRKAA
jgi:hypothetical protein